MTKIHKMALLFLGLFSVIAIAAEPAMANNFSSVAKNMTLSLSNFPTLISALSYLFGLLLGVLGIMKVKDHVENPGQTPLKDGAIRLAAGGGLFALPMIYEAAKNTIGTSAVVASQADLGSLAFP